VLAALAFLHGQGLQHGHVHSGNVFLGDNTGVALLAGHENAYYGLRARNYALCKCGRSGF
jgi:hypothetical protein